VAFVAQTATRNRSAGFRAANRLLALAERLAIPVLTLIDTPGAADDADAETTGIGPAIAQTFLLMAALRAPVTSVLVGEGGSGGALALAAPGRLWAAPHSYLAVIAPELAAEILFADRSRAVELTEHLALRPADLVGLGLAVGVLDAASERGS